MRKPPAALTLAVALPFLAGCMGNVPQPLPDASSRSELAVRGVVLGAGGDRERVEFEEVGRVEWTDSTLAIQGVRKGEREREFVNHTYRLVDVDQLLVRQVDPNRTSLLIGGVIVGGIAILSVLVTGSAEDKDRVF